jgi:toxoflavin biosynthesis protein ToxD
MIRTGVVIAAVAACSGKAASVNPSTQIAPLSLAKDAQMISIPAGKYIAGSTPEERATAYDDYQRTAGHDAARTHKWFDSEEERHVALLEAFVIDFMPVTAAEYDEYVRAGHAPPPMIDEAGWAKQGFMQDYDTVMRFAWRDGAPPAGRADHPVVLVTQGEASSYCAWRGKLAGELRRLPSEPEFEKAARGDQGLAYPWGNVYEPDKLNSAVKGPRDTTPVGHFVDGASPYGVLDAAGNVFQWTSTSFAPGKMTVKGSAWDDFAGLGRGAGRHGRPSGARHVIVGFRCAAPA